MNPIAFQIGPIAVHWYGILIVTGILAAAYLSTYTAKLWAEDPQLVWDALVWCVFLGVIGARLYHVVTGQPSTGVDLQYYLQHPLKIFATWEGGLGIYGAVAGGALGLFIVIRRAKRDIWRWMDITVPGLVLAQAIGRWGNFINQELYGQPTDLPWGLYIPPSHRLPGYDIYERFHPIFFYESMWNLATCLVLVYLTWRYRDRLVSGIITCIYFIAYSTIRFLLEFIRLDSPAVGEGMITIAQIVALVLIVAFLALMIWRFRVGQKPQAASASAGEDEGVQVEETQGSESTGAEEEATDQVPSDESTLPAEAPAEDVAFEAQEDAGEEKEEA
ncbi:MAG: prolipoprotein diacylglyceryl transferase [Anaerolineae bacterium]|nr:prolipoprotein diacylglyceryl transferase [Anaerolineae bacterium]